MSSTVSFELDGQPVTARPGEFLLDVVRRSGPGNALPALCRGEEGSRGHEPEGGCRLCLVEVAGRDQPVAACHTPVAAGLVVRTDSARLTALRRGVLELMAGATPGATRETGRGGAAAGQFRRLLEDHGVAMPDAGVEQASPVSSLHPYLRFDPAACITCRRCLQACADIQGQFVFGVAGRGAGTRLIFGTGESFLESPCVSCGACVEACPSGALFDRDREAAPAAGTRVVQTVCAYCGVGCRLDVTASGEGDASAVLAITGTREASVNRGHLCAKGRYAHGYLRSGDRLTTPLLRTATGWQPLSWEEALSWAARRLAEIRDAHGPDALGVLTSSRSTNEAAYLLQKLFRTVIGTNNVDCCARVCHSSTAAALQLMTGTGAATASYADIESARLIVVAGANPTEAHPVVGARIRQAVRRGAELLVVDPRRTELVALARQHLALRPGTNVALFNALARVILEEGLADEAYLAERTEGLEGLEAFLKEQSLETAATITGIPVESIREAGRCLGRAGGVLFVTGLGLSELTQGTASVMTLTNLALLTGGIGRPGAGVLALRGQNNVQGNADMGAMPDQLTGYQPVADPGVRARAAAVWGREPPARPGLKVPEMLEAARAGQLQALWIQGEDIAQSDPNEAGVRAALESLDLLVVQELFHSETARYAHLLLPAAGALEQDGTFTNAERRIQRVRAVVPPPGEARPDWIVARDLGRKMSGDAVEGWDHPDPAAVMTEIARVAPDLFGGVDYRRLDGDGLQWPCPHPAHPGTRIVHEDRIVSGRAKLMIVPYEPSPETTTPELPFLLITGRVLHHYNVGTMTRRTPHRELVPADFLEIHPADAGRLGLRDGMKARLRSRYGEARVPVRHSTRVSPGILFLSFHFPDSHTNALTSTYGDPRSRCPEYKVTAVAVTAA